MKTFLRTTLLLSAICWICSCQKCISVSETESEFSLLGEPVTKVTSSGDFLYSKVDYEFLAAKDLEKWGNILGLENRFEACSIPEDIIADMSTVDMANLIVHFPLNYLIFAYNDPLDAVKLVFDRSPLHAHFTKRPDSGNVIAEIFSKTVVDMSIERSCYDNRLDTLSYVNELFLDYLVASKIVEESIDSEHRDMITSSAERKIIEREADSMTFSSYSIMPLYMTVSSTVSTSYHTIRTFFGNSLHGITYDEMGNTEIINCTNLAVTNYPNAILRGSATRKYNCHSYAWHKQSLQNTTWLNSVYNGSLQLSKYWTDDLYVSCPEESAEKVFYANGDHSAIVLSNENYLSKWGAWPLMEHAPTDCPYYSSSLQYYKERTEPLYIQVIGNRQVIVGETNQYYVGNSFQSGYNWSVSYMDIVGNPGPSVLDNSQYSQCALTCNDMGLFKLYLNIDHNGHTVAYGQADIIATPY